MAGLREMVKEGPSRGIIDVGPGIEVHCGYGGDGIEANL